MDNNTDILHEAKKLRLLAAALELQHFTNTASNVVPIPGTERFVVIGTPEEVAGLLAAPEVPIPDILFDGHAVYADMMSNDPHTPCPTADNVADVLDAVVRLLRRATEAAPEARRRCTHCDDTGDVHRADGEWLGRCSCPFGGSTSSTDGSAP